MRELFSPTAMGTKSAWERHHLLPKAYFARIGVTDDQDRNQTASFAFIEWADSLDILDCNPAEYMKDQITKIPPSEKDAIHVVHALPNNWEHMDYADFLAARRVMMAPVIKRGYEKKR